MRAIRMGQELRNIETSLSVNNVPYNCLVSLRIVRDITNTPGTFIATLHPIEQIHQLVNRLVGSQARHTLDQIIGQSSAVRRVRRQALMAANANGCVLLQGETGTGKNTLARAIHNGSSRAAEPFLALNLRAIPRDLILGEFLGYESGAFNSGIAGGQPSKFELANGGTLYLSEIDALPFDAQAALLRIIESGDVIRLGGRRIIPVNVRIIASSSRDLQECVAEGIFRTDLCFLLMSFVISLVPLRERSEDMTLIRDNILSRLSVQFNQTLRMDETGQQVLNNYAWPGNITELESVLERAASLCEGQIIRAEHLPDSIRQRWAPLPGTNRVEPVVSLAEAERRAIVAAGRATHGNMSQAAQILGIGRTTLWRRMRDMGISEEELAT
jgi:transcriptional activator for dhaKLM operon